MSTKQAAKTKLSAVRNTVNMSQSSDTLSTRALLALWSLEKSGGKAVSSGKLKKYENFWASLEQSGTVTITTSQKGRYMHFSISDAGKQRLVEGLLDPQFSFDGTVASSREVNDALELIRHHAGSGVVVAPTNGNGTAVSAIESYEAFKDTALEVFDRLNRDYNMDNLVPIYRIRREIGDRVKRSEFNEWLLEMQATDILQLLEGSVEDSAPDKIEDSIMTKVSGLRCYAKRLDP